MTLHLGLLRRSVPTRSFFYTQRGRLVCRSNNRLAHVTGQGAGRPTQVLDTERAYQLGDLDSLSQPGTGRECAVALFTPPIPSWRIPPHPSIPPLPHTSPTTWQASEMRCVTCDETREKSFFHTHGCAQPFPSPPISNSAPFPLADESVSPGGGSRLPPKLAAALRALSS